MSNNQEMSFNDVLDRLIQNLAIVAKSGDENLYRKVATELDEMWREIDEVSTLLWYKKQYVSELREIQKKKFTEDNSA